MMVERLPPTPIALLAIVVALFFFRVLYVLSSIHRGVPARTGGERRRTRPVSTLVVLGSGGHTTEMVRLLSSLDPNRYDPLVYVVASTDSTSLDRIAALPLTMRRGDGAYRIPRSREVGQSYVTSIATTLRSLLSSLFVVGRVRPDLVLCNGPGTCLPIVVSALLLRVVGLAGGHVIFVESFCRVKSLSLTGRLLYPIVDKFIVHWPELQEKHSRSEIVSTFICHDNAEESAKDR